MLPNVLQPTEADHVPVLADEVRELLAVQPGETVVDATFGAGGHARLLAEDLAGRGKLVAIDRDPGAKSYFDRFKARAGVDVRFLRGDFALVLSQLAANEVKADAILLDLGISSMQVDRPERGFSYATDARLDMRMDPSSEPTAAAIVNTWDERELVTIFRRYGEERFAGCPSPNRAGVGIASLITSTSSPVRVNGVSDRRRTIARAIGAANRSSP